MPLTLAVRPVILVELVIAAVTEGRPWAPSVIEVLLTLVTWPTMKSVPWPPPPGMPPPPPGRPPPGAGAPADGALPGAEADGVAPGAAAAAESSFVTSTAPAPMTAAAIATAVTTSGFMRFLPSPPRLPASPALRPGGPAPGGASSPPGQSSSLSGQSSSSAGRPPAAGHGEPCSPTGSGDCSGMVTPFLKIARWTGHPATSEAARDLTYGRAPCLRPVRVVRSGPPDEYVAAGSRCPAHTRLPSRRLRRGYTVAPC